VCEAQVALRPRAVEKTNALNSTSDSLFTPCVKGMSSSDQLGLLGAFTAESFTADPLSESSSQALDNSEALRAPLIPLSERKSSWRKDITNIKKKAVSRVRPLCSLGLARPPSKAATTPPLQRSQGSPPRTPASTH